jgi:hypothetical protein
MKFAHGFLIVLLIFISGCSEVETFIKKMTEPPPLSISRRDSLRKRGKVVILKNNSDIFLYEVKVKIEGAPKIYSVATLNPQNIIEVGWMELGGWNPPLNFEVKVTCKGWLQPFVHEFRSDGQVFSSTVEHNIYQNYRLGMRISSNISVEYQQNADCIVGAFFYNSDQKPLSDQNADYNSSDGQVAAYTNYSPTAEHDRRNVDIFIPYDELHLSDGLHNLKYRISVFDGVTSTEFVSTGNYDFQIEYYQPPPISINIRDSYYWFAGKGKVVILNNTANFPLYNVTVTINDRSLHFNSIAAGAKEEIGWRELSGYMIPLGSTVRVECPAYKAPIEYTFNRE